MELAGSQLLVQGHFVEVSCSKCPGFSPVKALECDDMGSWLIHIKCILMDVFFIGRLHYHCTASFKSCRIEMEEDSLLVKVQN